MQLVLDTNDLWVRRKSGRFEISTEAHTRTISPAKIDSIAVLSRCTFTSAALLLAVENEIPVYFFKPNGDPAARLWSPYFSSLATLRRAQVLFCLSEEHLDWCAALFSLKTEGQRILLARLDTTGETDQFQNALKDASATLAAERPSDTDPKAYLMGVEGAAARQYWRGLSAMLPEGYRFEQRSRRPALDLFNAALNYVYGMMYNVVERAALAAGLDPMLGMLHADEYNHPTLSFDLIEPFRPFVDELIAGLCRSQALEHSMFDISEDGSFWLNRAGRKLLIPAFNELLEQPVLFQKEEARLQLHIFTFAGSFARHLRNFSENARFTLLRH